MCNCEGVQRVEVDGKHASSADFCRLFAQEMASLYKLAFLLTASHKEAEQCLLSALDEAFGVHGVHRPWALSWSKRAVIKQAIRMTTLEPIRDDTTRDDWEYKEYESAACSVINAVTRLAPLERFVFVLSVLERLSYRDCAVLLNCTPQNVSDARVRALQQLPTLANGVTDLSMPVVISTTVRMAVAGEIGGAD
jgi:DNA-directed RNA polymerase specialized sigma24 family protein